MEMMKSLDSGKLKGVKRKEAGRRKIQKLRNLEIRGVYLRAVRLRRDWGGDESRVTCNGRNYCHEEAQSSYALRDSGGTMEVDSCK